MQRSRLLHARSVSRPRVFCMEWMDPVYCCGHWVPEMVRIAGGFDRLGREGADSVRVRWEDVLDWKPEVLIVMPCGFDLEKTFEEAQRLTAYPGWDDLPAVRNGRVYAVDANSYFARPGPRVVEGTELLAHLLHPELFEWRGPARRVPASGLTLSDRAGTGSSRCVAPTSRHSSQSGCRRTRRDPAPEIRSDSGSGHWRRCRSGRTP